MNIFLQTEEYWILDYYKQFLGELYMGDYRAKFNKNKSQTYKTLIDEYLFYYHV